jgi:putative hydrolase of the HAD superfamily
MPTRAVLFDAVGTLIRLREPVGVTYARLGGGDAAALQAAFVSQLRARAPMAFADQPAAALQAAERAWWHELVRDVFGAAGRTLSSDSFDSLWNHYAGGEAWVCAPGAIDLLRRLRAAGGTTAVVSNFDHRLHAVLAALALTPQLDIVVLPADAGAAKPDARIFQLALRRLGVAASDAVYVGDDPHDDHAGAAAAGLRVVDVTAVRDLRDLAL